MTNWEYISTSPEDFREERKISDNFKMTKHKKPKRIPIPEPTTPHLVSGSAYFHTWEGWLNLLGSQGWEVCSAGGWGAGGGSYWTDTQLLGSEFMVILKREID